MNGWRKSTDRCLNRILSLQTQRIHIPQRRPTDVRVKIRIRLPYRMHL
jgi:hypothetical protein